MYLSHKCLWDTSHEHYKSKFKRRDAYRDIATKFSTVTNVFTDERVAINKIKNLRSTYRQELLKIKTRETYKPSLRWFADWHKCFRRIEIRAKKHERRSSDDQQEAETELEDTSKDWLGDDTEARDNNSDLDQEPFVNPTDEEEYNLLLLKQEPEIDAEPLPTYKSRKRKISNSFSSDQSRVISALETTSNDDEFEIYARYIASQLRKMDIEKALRVQLQIQSLISEARIESLGRTE